MKNLILLMMLVAFFGCQPQTSETSQSQASEAEISQEEYMKMGKDIAAQTFSVLSGQLQAAMKEGGVAQAIKHCNLAAMPLVDSLSKVHQADIRRTSFKIRNSQNAPNNDEQVVLEAFTQSAAEGKDLVPLVKATQEGNMAFYAPIKVNDMCLKCHGVDGESLDSEGYALIRELYPEDEATGYQAGDLRGIWSITFN